MDESEKNIYNFYLKALAEKNGRPYKKRVDFSTLSIENKMHLKKLSLFFRQYRDVNPLYFFRAGFKYETNTYPTLEYFTSLRASSLYSKYIRHRYNEDIDNNESVNDFKNGIYFIYTFLSENNITLSEYKTCKNEFGVKWFIIHLKKQNISFYHIHALGIPIEEFPDDYQELISDDFKKTFYETLNLYNNSIKVNEIGKKFNKFSTRLLRVSAKKDKEHE